MEKYDLLKLENQLCFPLYALSREVIKLYKPFLDKFDLTYTQYITMMVLWDTNKISFKELGYKLYLDSGTLTPVLKKLESKGFITKYRNKEDDRLVTVEITETGMNLKEQMRSVPESIYCNFLVEDNILIDLKEKLNLILENNFKK